jgi:hypothetical protein
MLHKPLIINYLNLINIKNHFSSFILILRAFFKPLKCDIQNSLFKIRDFLSSFFEKTLHQLPTFILHDA